MFKTRQKIMVKTALCGSDGVTALFFLLKVQFEDRGLGSIGIG